MEENALDDLTFGILSFSATWAAVVAQEEDLVQAEASEVDLEALAEDSVVAVLVAEALLVDGKLNFRKTACLL